MKVLKIALIILGVMAIAAPIILGITVTVVNDSTAAGVEKELLSLPLPEDTAVVESLYKAGKLSGNGNGMQYLGAALITSGLPLEELREYYAKYGCYVYTQETGEIEELHGSIGFKTDPVPENAYRVELWGDAVSSIFYELDLRGH